MTMDRWHRVVCHAALIAMMGGLPAISAQEPRWFKGNLHTHSLWSDGNDFPEMIALWYREHGYHFLALSDHNLLSRGERWFPVRNLAARGAPHALERYLERLGPQWVELRGSHDDPKSRAVRLKPLSEVRPLVEEAGRFLMIEAEEITDHFAGIPVHMNATNLADVVPPQGGASVRDVIERNLAAVEDQARRTGRKILAHLNHPNFGWAVTAEDLAAVTRERFFEVYNGHPATHQFGDDDHLGTERMWDVANTLRLNAGPAPPLFGIATDDSHHYHAPKKANQSRPGRGWIWVRSRFLTPEHLIAAMERGDFYASTGVRLARLLNTEEFIEIEVAAEPDVDYRIEFVGTLRHDAEELLAESDPAATETHSAASIGRVLKSVDGARARFELTGRELYVRAVVRSTASPADAGHAGEVPSAWTQPVGWRRRFLEAMKAKPR